MKILMINSVVDYGSTGKICRDIASTLSNTGHEVMIAYGRRIKKNALKTDIFQIGSNVDVLLHVAKTRFFDQHGFGSKRATRKLIKYIDEFNPDIIHIHNLHGYYLNIKVLFEYFKKSNKQIIWTLHDCWPITGHCTNFESIACNKWKIECANCKQNYIYPKSFFSKNIKSNYRIKKDLFSNVPNMTIVTPSRWLKSILEESFLNEYEIKVINNGIDTNVFKHTESDLRNKYNLQEKKILLGVASGLGEKKGFYDFISLSEKIDENCVIVLIGLDPNKMKNLPSNVIGMSRTNNAKELAQWYSLADIFLNFTYEDNYPTVNLEAQSCGTPVLTYNTGGSGESVPIENILDVGDYDSVRFYFDKDLKIANMDYSKEAMMTKYLQLYNNKYRQG